MTPVAILGAGSWGTALAVQLGSREIPVTLVGRDPDRVAAIRETGSNARYLPGVSLPPSVTVTSRMEDVTPCDTVVLAVPSQMVRAVVRDLPAGGPESRLLVNTAKGLEQETTLRLSQVIRQEARAKDRVAVLSGPSHAEEVARFLPTAIVAGSEDPEAAWQVQNLFMSDSLRVYTSEDLIGVEMGGAVKNVIALAAGINVGLGFGDNSTAALVTRGLYEIVKLGVATGARAETFSGLTGLGDLMVTCNSTHSRNRTCGVRLGRGEALETILADMGMVVEGVMTTAAVKRLADGLQVEMPIVEEVHQVLFAGKAPRQSVLDLMTRTKKEEMSI